MGKVIPFRRPPWRKSTRTGRNTSTPRGHKAKWTQPSDYGLPAAKGARWFPAVLVAAPAAAFTAVLLAPPLGGGPDAAEAQGLFSAAASSDREAATFELCSESYDRSTCVIDGDTFWYEGTKIRIADIDTPEVSRPGCAEEAALGEEATLRLQELLNAGAFTLADDPDGETTDRYGRALHVVTRKGESIGETLVDEGLAEQWGGPRIDWC
jgi:endonuclease YncB( thermonuclease family)